MMNNNDSNKPQYRIGIERGAWSDFAKANSHTILAVVDAVVTIQSGSNVSMYKDWPGTKEEKYNYNNVWRLVKNEGTTWTSWVLYFEGKAVFGLREAKDHDYCITLVDAYEFDEWTGRVIKRAEKTRQRLG